MMAEVTAATPTATPKWKRILRKVLIFVLVVGVPLGVFTWYKFFREVPQPEWITSNDEKNFLYGSIGSESQAGIPYWIVVVLPRIFGTEYLPGPGGYASLGLPWEQGQEFPAGFSKKTVGFDRVAFNCALCHSTQYRLTGNETPHIVAAGGSHTADIQGLLEFFSRSAADARFNADTILTEIDLATRLSTIDRLIYKYLLIPMTKKQLVQQGQDFAWAHSRPRWGPGRDAPMNLTKFNFLKLPMDDSVDNTDFPSIWHLDARVQPGRVWKEDDFAETADFSKAPVDQSRLMLMNLAGDTTSFRSVLIDSALGLQAKNTDFFRRRMADLEGWLRKLPPPKYPLQQSDADRATVPHGQAVFEQQCAACHASGRDNRMGTVIPVEEVGTDAERTHAWTRQAADGANATVAGFGIRRTPMSKPPKPGYTAMQMDGLWLRAPYLHNGSVPTLSALLEKPECRPKTFYRGFDVLDPDHVGFVSARCGEAAPPPAPGCSSAPVQSGCMPPEKGWRFDVTLKGNGNGGHDYGTALSDAEKKALVTYLKTL
jgi:mono/diheme cytochrome c family protein